MQLCLGASLADKRHEEADAAWRAADAHLAGVIQRNEASLASIGVVDRDALQKASDALVQKSAANKAAVSRFQEAMDDLTSALNVLLAKYDHEPKCATECAGIILRLERE